jgi:hypothetical protein
MNTALLIAAVLIAIVGVVLLFSGSVIAGIVLLVIACLVGPGGYSILKK